MAQNTAITTLPKAVLSFLFSVENPTAFFCTELCIKAIDDFFDSLELEKVTNPLVHKILFADAFMHFDTDNRFAYIGSNTMPPCTEKWYRTVAMTIYPIKQRHLDLYKNTQLPRGATDGNNRKTQTVVDAH